MEKSNDDRPRPLKERRNYYDSENRPVPRTPRRDVSRDTSRPTPDGETPAGYRTGGRTGATCRAAATLLDTA